MKIIPFDVEKAKSGKYKIQTKDGEPVRIICWDKKTKYDVNLVGLVDCGDFEIPISINENNSNLVLVDENAPNIRQRIFDIILEKCNEHPSLAYITPLSAMVLADFIQEGLNLPKWKHIYKGEKLPETAYVKTKTAGVCHIPSGKGVKVGCDCWYLPVTVLDELENEEQRKVEE